MPARSQARTTEVLETLSSQREGRGGQYGVGWRDGRQYHARNVWEPLPHGVDVPDAYGFVYRTAPCTCCGRSQEVKDSLRWWGEGNMRWLIGHQGDPCNATYRGSGAERLVPSKMPTRPTTIGEAAARPGNDPSQAAATNALMDTVGRLKRDLLPSVRDPIELDMMQTIKASLDPKGIMNPGRLLPDR